MSIATPCLGNGERCANMATRHGRCDSCRSQWNAARNRKPERVIYRGTWRATSAKARKDQPWCSICYSNVDLTLDHTTGMVVCRFCHRSEAQGGVKKSPALRSGAERF